jgi:hypothetical protein
LNDTVVEEVLVEDLLLVPDPPCEPPWITALLPEGVVAYQKIANISNQCSLYSKCRYLKERNLR